MTHLLPSPHMFCAPHVMGFQNNMRRAESLLAARVEPIRLLGSAGEALDDREMLDFAECHLGNPMYLVSPAELVKAWEEVQMGLRCPTLERKGRLSSNNNSFLDYGIVHGPLLNCALTLSCWVEKLFFTDTFVVPLLAASHRLHQLIGLLKQSAGRVESIEEHMDGVWAAKPDYAKAWIESHTDNGFYYNTDVANGFASCVGLVLQNFPFQTLGLQAGRSEAEYELTPRDWAWVRCQLVYDLMTMVHIDHPRMRTSDSNRNWLVSTLLNIHEACKSLLNIESQRMASAAEMVTAERKIMDIRRHVQGLFPSSNLSWLDTVIHVHQNQRRASVSPRVHEGADWLFFCGDLIWSALQAILTHDHKVNVEMYQGTVPCIRLDTDLAGPAPDLDDLIRMQADWVTNSAAVRAKIDSAIRTPWIQRRKVYNALDWHLIMERSGLLDSNQDLSLEEAFR